MMTSSKPWQAIVNANNLPNVIVTENNLTVAKPKPSASKKANVYSSKVVTTKRYSFDDNGGGYAGL
ncbi:MAG TPA: hypothetical protein VER36_00970 [Flavisolibacter sp.]|nr:hypothetical protein [Flavisolibacter sp.]